MCIRDRYNTVVNLAYTFFVSQVNKMDGELRPTSHYLSSSWNVGHIFNVSAIHKFGANWTVGAKWYLSGGVPYTPYDEDVYKRQAQDENSVWTIMPHLIEALKA